jgi:hypothetical protein
VVGVGVAVGVGVVVVVVVVVVVGVGVPGGCCCPRLWLEKGCYRGRMGRRSRSPNPPHQRTKRSRSRSRDGAFERSDRKRGGDGGSRGRHGSMNGAERAAPAGPAAGGRGRGATLPAWMTKAGQTDSHFVNQAAAATQSAYEKPRSRESYGSGSGSTSSASQRAAPHAAAHGGRHQGQNGASSREGGQSRGDKDLRGSGSCAPARGQGRGRGISNTLPAWMTAQQNEERVGALQQQTQHQQPATGHSSGQDYQQGRDYSSQPQGPGYGQAEPQRASARNSYQFQDAPLRDREVHQPQGYHDLGRSSSNSMRTRPPAPLPQLPDPWQAVLDPATNKNYYWNTETQAVQWDIPDS